MANNTIYANIGTYGVNDTPSVGPLMQAQTGVVMLFTLADLTGAPIDLTDLALSGTITNNLTTETAALAGALTIVTPAAGVFSWTTDEDDVGTAGDFTLVFMAGADIISLPAHLSILETPGASVTFGAALIGVTTAERAWLTAALAALPDASQLGTPVDAEDLTANNGGVNDLIAVDGFNRFVYLPALDFLGAVGGPDPVNYPAGYVWTTTGTDSGFFSSELNMPSIKTDTDTTPGNTRLLLWDVDTGALVRVSVGADDSGGTGYKVLRIPNNG